MLTDQQIADAWKRAYPSRAAEQIPFSFANELLRSFGPPVEAPLGWLYDWTHSSALGKPDEHFTGFTEDEAYAHNGVGHHNVRPVYGSPRGVRGLDGGQPK